MSVKFFEATVEHLPRVSVIVLSGLIAASARDQLVAAYAGVVSEASEGLVLDFGNVTYINSSGIALLVDLISRAHRAKRRLVVSSLSGHYQRIFEITRLAEYVTIVPDRTAALNVLVHEPA